MEKVDQDVVKEPDVGTQNLNEETDSMIDSVSQNKDFNKDRDETSLTNEDPNTEEDVSSTGDTDDGNIDSTQLRESASLRGL